MLGGGTGSASLTTVRAPSSTLVRLYVCFRLWASSSEVIGSAAYTGMPGTSSSVLNRNS